MNEGTEIMERPQRGEVLSYRSATDAASVCKQIVLSTAVTIQHRKYVRVEGWQAIAIAHGCVASSGDVKRVEGGISATGTIRRGSDGMIVAQAEGFVGDEEPTWGKRPEYAKRAMAQTRAISRACRSAFAHVVVMMDAGLQTTPAEEVPEGGFEHGQEPPEVKQPQTTTAKAPAKPAAPAAPKQSAATRNGPPDLDEVCDGPREQITWIVQAANWFAAGSEHGADELIKQWSWFRTTDRQTGEPVEKSLKGMAGLSKASIGWVKATYGKARTYAKGKLEEEKEQGREPDEGKIPDGAPADDLPF
jgi:hypothetical protein